MPKLILKPRTALIEPVPYDAVIELVTDEPSSVARVVQSAIPDVPVGEKIIYRPTAGLAINKTYLLVHEADILALMA